MKGLVLAAGRGKRLGVRSEEHNKSMLSFFGKPLVQYSLENAARAGVCEIVVVIGYQAQEIVGSFGSEFRGIRLRYVTQEDAQGLVHAIDCSRAAVGDSDFMLFLADEVLCNPDHVGMMKAFAAERHFVTCGVVVEHDREEIRKTYAVIENERDHRIHRLIEKPRNPPNPIRGTGNCIFRPGIFDYVPLTPINHFRGEKELPDLIQCAIDDGHVVKSYVIGDHYININTPEDIANAEREYSAILAPPARPLAL